VTYIEQLHNLPQGAPPTGYIDPSALDAAVKLSTGLCARCVYSGIIYGVASSVTSLKTGKRWWALWRDLLAPSSGSVQCKGEVRTERKV